MVFSFRTPPPYFDTNSTAGQRTLAIGACALCSAVYIRYVVGRVARPGMGRLLLAAPVMCFALAAPSVFNTEDEILGRTATLFIISWLLNFKVLAYCLNRGALTMVDSFPQLAAVMLLPIFPVRGPSVPAHSVSANGVKSELAEPAAADVSSASSSASSLCSADGEAAPTHVSTTATAPGSSAVKLAKQGRLDDHGSSAWVLLARWFAKMGCLGLVVYVLITQKMPRVVTDYLEAFGMYAFIGLLMDGPASVVTQFLGFKITPTFDQPWLSTSFADFWGRRWNIVTSSTLRTLVYDTIADRSFVKPYQRPNRPSEALRMFGICATFAASGLAHEYILWMLQPDGQIGWKWFTFFAMQGPCIIVEGIIVKACLKRRIEVQQWVSIVLTLGLLEVTAYYFFFAPVVSDTDTADRVIRACQLKYSALLDGVMRLRS